MKTVIIKQEVTLNAPPKAVYDAFLDSKKHTKFTGAKATTSKKLHGEFSCYDGSITGRNIQLNVNQKIVQQWRASDWPKGHFSRATLSLYEVRPGVTRILFRHAQVPVSKAKSIKAGWGEHYWDKMRHYFQ